MSHSSRLRWHCRRGMRELDVLLLRYLETRFDVATATDKDAFRSLLALSDPELNGYLLQGQKPSAEPLARVIEQILGLPYA